MSLNTVLKSQLRKKALFERNLLDPKEVHSKSLVIQKNALYFIQKYKPSGVLSYCHINSEVQTDFLNKTLLEYSYILALPKVVNDNLIFLCINSYRDLQKGYAGILEPRDTSCVYRFTENTLIILPGLLFDENGYRLGYGKAFYDRLLAEHPRMFTMALAFNFQIIKSLPAECHDRPVNAIITELQSNYL